jgi:nitroimidazol reductase NimA-like FMN-containing flavoprotein (pyridoxamine 5'-phosphate oxidase superfamily)
MGSEVVWMDDLDEGVCWRLVAGQRLGRIGFVVDGRPTVRPVNHAVDGRTIVVRTDRGTSVGALGSGATVVYEVDEGDPRAETGWSVLVEGRTADVTEPDELQRLGDLTLHPWAPGAKDHWIRIVADAISGRAISRRRSAPEGTFLPYMPPD